MFIPVASSLGYSTLAGLVLGESAGLPIPGETALITAAGLAADGRLVLPIVIAIAAAAAILGDTIGYWLGRRGGRRLLLRDGLGATHRRAAVVRADRWFARNGTATVVVGRFIPGVRVVAAVMAGATRMPYGRFAAANAAGALGWAAGIGLLAYAVGPAGAAALAIGGLALGAALAIGTWWRARGRSGVHASSLG